MLSLLDSIIGKSATADNHHVPPVTIGEDTPTNFGDYVHVDPHFTEILGTRFPRRVFNNTSHQPIPADLKEQLAWQASPAVDPRSLVPSSHDIFHHITKSMAETLLRLAELERDIDQRPSVLLTGPTGCGKTTIVKTACFLANEPCIELTFSGDTTLTDFFHRTEVIRESGGTSTVAVLGPAIQAMLHGYKLLINEINMLPPDLLSALTQAMDTGHLIVSGTEMGNIEIEVHERFGVIATANPNYVGTTELGRAFQRRFGWGLGMIPMGFLPCDEEVTAVLAEFNRQPITQALDFRADRSVVERLVAITAQLREHSDFGPTLLNRLSTRTLVHWLTLGHTTGLPLADIAERALLSTVPKDLVEGVATVIRQALGRLMTSASEVSPNTLRSVMLTGDAPTVGCAIAIPDNTEVITDAQIVEHPSGSKVRLANGDDVNIFVEAKRPPKVSLSNGSSNDEHDVSTVRRALRDQHGINLASALGHLPSPESTLPCLTSSSWSALRLAQGTLIAGHPVFLRGPTGCGKSALARTIGRLWNLSVVEFSLTGETSKADLTATRQLDAGITTWSIQAFLEAAHDGKFVIVNEYNLAYPDVHSIINGLFDKTRSIRLADGQIIRAHKNFRLVATGFPEGPGVKPLNEGVENRFGAVIHMDYPCQEEELAILAFVSNEKIDVSLLNSAVELVSAGRSILSGTWDKDQDHPLNNVPTDLSGAAADRTGLTTAELIAMVRVSTDADAFVGSLRHGVLDGSDNEVKPVLEATLAGYGLV